MTKESPTKKKLPLLSFGIYGAMGFQLGASVVGGLLVGYWLDGKWGTKPWLGLIGLLAGSVSGFYHLLKLVDWNRQRKEPHDGTS